MRKFLIVLAVIAGVAVIGVVGVLLLNSGSKEILALEIKDVDLGAIPDGVYAGRYYKGRWTYDVEVTVKDHRIAAVVNTNSRMSVNKDWNEEAARAVIAKQTPNVDIVSGASINSRAFEKAVENALETAVTR